MGLLLFLKACLGSREFSAKLKAFDRLDEQVQFCIWNELRSQYAGRATPELAGALAGQVMKYLMGHDLDAVRRSAEPDRRNELDACRPEVESEADKLMRSDPLVNELVRRSLMTKFVLYSCQYGSRWLESADGTSTEAQIRRYDDGVPNASGLLDMDGYVRCAYEYLARTDAAEQARSGSASSPGPK